MTADRGYGEKNVDDAHALGVRIIVIPGKDRPGKATKPKNVGAHSGGQ